MQTATDAISTVYARSLFELAQKEGGREAIEATLGELEEILELTRQDRSFAEFLSSRVVSADRRGVSLNRICSGRVSSLTSRFLQILNRKQRLGHLSSIASAYDGLVQAHFGRVEVDVITADPLSPEDLRGVQSKLSATLGQDVIAHPYTDASMIGGVKFRLGDRLIDASLATRLRKMRDQLSTSASATIRANFDRIVEG
ncbi:MAG: ATP synthase F1 subunit delta [Phycisphaeraceae bacterium]|nr:ATP synthase F1 subunit delta [Phycisphaerae bacterium]MBX3392542.1 ATP synthase F1 subunit delta [Phycisphaeraceae bacterium]HRJ50352.1 ATP synthase F1 subunit delta [Phycisphaerales bacterium]